MTRRKDAAGPSDTTEAIARSLRFDSRSEAHKAPFGAVRAGTTITFQVSAHADLQALTLVIEKRHLEGNQDRLEYQPLARVAMHRLADGGAATGTACWGAAHRFGDVAVYGYWFEAQINGRLFALQNNTDEVFWTLEKGSGGQASVAVLQASGLGAVRRFRQTVFTPDFQVPDWAADAVYYCIFPDRFRNGDPHNDPKPGRDRFHDDTVEFHASWLDQPYRPGSGDGSDALYNNDFFGGDLAGIIEKLDHVHALGANALYLTPIFRAASNHKYDTADYTQVDPAFGSNADFVRLTQEAARRGIRVIPDASFNHVGSDSIYFDRYGHFAAHTAVPGAFTGGRPRPESPYAAWFSFDTRQKDPDQQYPSWRGHKDLPELNKSSPAWRHFAYGGPDSITQLWLARGASGWRMDVAPWVPDDFWREWRTAVKLQRSDALTIAETWFDASKFLLGDMFDSTMNYVFRNTVLAYAAGGDARRLYANLEHLREAYPPQALHALMNLLSSHDVARSLHVLGWDSRVQVDTEAGRAAIALARQRFKLAVFFQMTFPGAPAVYYGDEVGVTGGDDPCNRATYPWPDLGGTPDEDLLATFKRLIHMRHRHPVLRRGELAAPLHVDGQVIVLLRRLQGAEGTLWAVTATNNGQAPRQLVLELPAELNVTRLRDAMSDEPAAPGPVRPNPAVLRLDLPALGGRAWVTHRADD